MMNPIVKTPAMWWMPVVVTTVVLYAASYAQVVPPTRRLPYSRNVAPELTCLRAMLDLASGDDAPGKDVGIPVFIMHSNSPTISGLAGRRKLDVAPHYTAAYLNHEDLARLQSDPAVRYLALAGDPRPMRAGQADLLPERIDVAAVRDQAPVIIGIIDRNLELALEFDPQLKRRVLRFWRQEWSPSSETMQESVFARPATVHGSVIAGIVARHAQNAGYVLVDSLWDQIDAVAALEFIRQTAACTGTPAVVNLSAGINAGPHDGSSLFEQILAFYARESFHLVVAAGNAGPACRHVEFAPCDLADDAIDLPLRISQEQDGSGGAFEACIDLWFSGRVPCRVQVASPGQRVSQPLGPHEGGLFVFGNTCVCICNDLSDPLNGNTNILIVLKGAQAGEWAGQWTVRLDSFPPGDFLCDGWLALGPQSRGRFMKFVSPRKTVQPPSTAHGVISVGVFDGAAAGRTFRSEGPSADGRPKPDVLLRSKHPTSYAAAYVTALLANLIAGDGSRSRAGTDALLAILVSEYPHIHSPGALDRVPVPGQTSPEVGER